MSVMSGISRAGSSHITIHQSALQPGAISLPGLSQSRGYAARNSEQGNWFMWDPEKSFRVVKRNEKGIVISKKKEKSLGAFRPLPVARLTNPLFQSDRREVLTLPTFSPQTATKNMIGKATEFSLTDNDPVRIFGLPKKMLLEFRILSKPCSIVRDVTVMAVDLLEKARDRSSLDTRVVLSGRPGCGKSFLLLQAVEHSVASGWIVIYIPRAVNLVNSTTPYEYDLRSRTYLQPMFAHQTLQRLSTVNASKLATLQTQRKLLFEKREVPAGTSLVDLINVALKEPLSSPTILDALMTELSQQTRYPVLLAVDDFQALYCRTTYRDPHFTTIRPYHLSIPRLIMNYASGKKSFVKGAFLGALTSSDPNYIIPHELRETLNLPYDHPSSPYDKHSCTLSEYTKGLRALRVPDQLSVEEAASLFEVWKMDKALVSSTYDELFVSKYAESSGNARDFVWKGLLSTLHS